MDVCARCGTVFEEGAVHCSRCGSDRASFAVQREIRELCATYMGEEQGEADPQREVRPLYVPEWGHPRWYELYEDDEPSKGRRRPKKRTG